MTFGQSIATCFGKYAKFEGRASRSEYWWFELFYCLVAIGCSMISDTLSGLAGLVFLLPVLSAGVRRMHDTGRSGWWIICPVANLVFLIFESQSGMNEYGEEPYE